MLWEYILDICRGYLTKKYSIYSEYLIHLTHVLLQLVRIERMKNLSGLQWIGNTLLSNVFLLIRWPRLLPLLFYPCFGELTFIRAGKSTSTILPAQAHLLILISRKTGARYAIDANSWTYKCIQKGIAHHSYIDVPLANELQLLDQST